MFVSKTDCFTVWAFFVLSLIVTSASGEQFSGSVRVESNVNILKENNNCPKCDLRGANLNRLDLSGANLEGADLSQAKMYLTNLSGANLKNSNLQEAEFGGADLANADLRGANLIGTSFSGAYMKGVLLEGEMISNKPYADVGINDVHEEVYVVDTVKSKSAPKTEKIEIAKTHGSQEQPPVMTGKILPVPADPATIEIPQESVAATEAKTAPAMHSVRIQEDVVLTPDKKRTELARQAELENQIEPAKQVEPEEQVDLTRQTELVSLEKGEKKDRSTALETGGVGADLPGTPSHSIEVLQNLEKLLDENRCYGCNLIGVNLNGENLDSADLEGANLSEAILTNTDLKDANLKGVNLSKANLAGANLSGADMYKANLTEADLTNTNLEKVLLDDAIMEGVKGYQSSFLLISN
jgi:uncharacterized protein YjbI with pentapeptide repeats